VKTNQCAAPKWQIARDVQRQIGFRHMPAHIFFRSM
jgi:hypothetical protein